MAGRHQGTGPHALFSGVQKPPRTIQTARRSERRPALRPELERLLVRLPGLRKGEPITGLIASGCLFVFLFHALTPKTQRQ